MTRRAPRPLLLIALCLAALAAAGCGNKHAVVTEAETEGPYLTVGALKYQVQLSRQLNPRDPEDRTYLQGIAADERELNSQQTWFAVFVRAVNETSRTQPSAEKFEIEDTQGRVFEPVPVKSNAFAYTPTRVPPHETLPAPGTVAETSPIGGSMVLFKLTLESLGNRPLELRIHSSQRPHEGIVDLDV